MHLGGTFGLAFWKCYPATILPGNNSLHGTDIHRRYRKEVTETDSTRLTETPLAMYGRRTKFCK